MNDFARDWAPYRLERLKRPEQGQEWLCRWFSRAGRRYSEPFFQETVTRCLGEQPNGKPYASFSSLDFLAHAAKNADAVAPSAFIFHVSRCGSTLLAQLLGLDRAHIVLSEVPLIDQLLRLPLRSDISHDAAASMLQATIVLLGERRFGETRLFVKLDSWHIHYAGLLRALYPDTPFILLSRTPHEILRSQRAERGTHAVPGLLEPALFGLCAEDVSDCDADSYLGKVLAYYYARFAELAHDRRNLLLDFRLGPQEMMQRLAQHIGMEIGADMRQQIRERSRFHSKRPHNAFSEAPVQEPVPACLVSAEEAYRRLGF